MSDGNKTIAAALLVAQKAAEAVGKTSRNEFAKFNYASAESMIAECRGALHGAGLVLFGTEQAVVNHDGEPVLHAVYLLLHEGGESIAFERQLPICVGKGKPMDRAMLGAATETLGYLLRDLLLIPRQEADVSGRDDRKHAPRKPAKPAPKPEAPPAARNPEAVDKARTWIEEVWGNKDGLDACTDTLKGLGLKGEDYAEVLAFFQEAMAAAK